MLTELQICEVIASKLGWTVEHEVSAVESNGAQVSKNFWHSPECKGSISTSCWPRSKYGCDWQPPDFYTDEAANARLLEAMRAKFPYVAIEFYKGITFELSGIEGGWSAKFATNDFMAATVYAFLKFAGIEVTHVD